MNQLGAAALGALLQLRPRAAGRARSRPGGQAGQRSPRRRRRSCSRAKLNGLARASAATRPPWSRRGLRCRAARDELRGCRSRPCARPATSSRVRDLHYAVGGRADLSRARHRHPRAAQSRPIMGPSGTGKTTLLRPDHRPDLRRPRARRSSTAQDVAALSRRELYALRRRMGMLFQNGALLTDLDVFENVAFPLREHTRLPERLIRHVVLTKLQAVGLRGAARADARGALGRHGAPRRARARDRDGPGAADLRRAFRRPRSRSRWAWCCG